MKVLITSDYENQNTIIKSYVDGISKYADVKSGIDNFWESNIKFEIIHIHWPEQLFNWQLFNENDLRKFELRLLYWKSVGAKVVVTRHNFIPHRIFELDRKLYDIVFKQSDAVVHLENFSFNEFRNNRKYSSAVNVVINHPNYLNLPNDVTRKNARKKFNIKDDKVLFLQFGTIRNMAEEKELIKAFKKLKVKKKKLLLAKSLLLNDYVPFERSPITRFRYEIKKILLKVSNVLIYENLEIDKTDIQAYFKASDIVIISRLNQLNSGVPYLAFSFSRIVIGPDIGNIGVLLRKTGNFLFRPGNIASLISAMQSAFNCLDSEIGKTNYRYAHVNCDIDKIGREHFELYKTLVANKCL